MLYQLAYCSGGLFSMLFCGVRDRSYREDGEVKAISLWQPWASLMAMGLKKNETRSWKTSYRGPLIIHAAKKVIGWPSLTIQGLFDDDIAFQPCDLPRGCLLCKVEMVDCQEIGIYNIPFREIEKELGDYTLGRYMWKTENVNVFEKPIPYRGSQGIFDVPDDVIKNVIPKGLGKIMKQQRLF